MIIVILLSRKFGVNPDNVATPVDIYYFQFLSAACDIPFSKYKKKLNLNVWPVFH